MRRTLLGLVAALAAWAGGADVVSVPVAPGYASGGYYRYCPATLVEDGVRHVFYCRNKAAYQVVDAIYHAVPETGRADAAWDLCMRTCWSPKTSLVYTCPPDKVKPAREFDDGPGYFHWRKGDPVKGTYGKGMGDCALICGTALSGLVDRWMVRPDDATRENAAKVARGLLNLASLHGRPGFVARGICEEDGRSVCSQSSIDQYTHWVHGLFRYAKSGMADEVFLRDWRRAVADVAQFLQSRCTPERNWNFGRFDGSDDPRGICAMWGPDLKAHAVARLPAIYLAAYDATGDRRWKEAYDAIADEALERSLGLADTKALYGTPCYILLQAQCSFEVIAALERAPARLEKLRKAMKAAAADARRRICVLARRPDQKFYGMCFDGELALALLMGGEAVSSAERDFVLGLAAKTRVDRPEVCRAAHVLAAEWRLARMAAPGKKVLGEASRVDGVDQWAMAVCTEGDRLYAAAGTSLYAFDISEPLKPKLLGSVSGFDNRRQIVAQGGFVYVVSRETGMRIVDARAPARMRIRSRFDSVEFATGIDVVGNVAFLSERINGVECVDVSDPDHPAHICIRKTGESQSCRYRDGWLYSGEWGGGTVTVFDAHDMEDFREVGSLDLHV